ncbi:hypothetical protein ACLFKQ_24355 [Myxosarcina sp. GI1(2024)]
MNKSNLQRTVNSNTRKQSSKMMRSLEQELKLAAVRQKFFFLLLLTLTLMFDIVVNQSDSKLFDSQKLMQRQANARQEAPQLVLTVERFLPKKLAPLEI